jgi:hypothetical protein
MPPIPGLGSYIERSDKKKRPEHGWYPVSFLIILIAGPLWLYFVGFGSIRQLGIGALIWICLLLWHTPLNLVLDRMLSK